MICANTIEFTIAKDDFPLGSNIERSHTVIFEFISIIIKNLNHLCSCYCPLLDAYKYHYCHDF